MSFTVKDLVEIVPIFHTVFARVYHCAISELCKGLYYRNGVWYESPRPQIHRFRPQARVLCRLEQAFLTNAAATVRSVGAV